MSNLVRNGLILLACLLISIWAVFPPGQKLRKGKDLAGGASLIYQVDIKAGESGDVLEKVKQVIKERLDPQGILQIDIVAQGSDRLEITMPLPGKDVKELRAKFDEVLKGLSGASVTAEEFDRVAAGAQDKRAAWIAGKAGSDDGMKRRLEQALQDFDARAVARKALAAADAEVTSAKDKIRNLGTSDASDPILQSMNAALAVAEASKVEAVNAVAQADIAFESTRAMALSAGLTGPELRRVLLLSDTPIRLPNEKKEMVNRPSPRAAALADIEKRYPDQAAQIVKAIEAWNDYAKQRKSLDDPEDIVRILKGAGVLNFRITVKPGEHSQEQELRNQLRQGGPTAVKAEDAHFYKVNKLEGWAETIEDLDRMRQSPSAYFLARGLVAEEYKGQPYILLWNKRGLRLTEVDGEWTLTKSFQGTDQLGRPAIDFQMDALGANKLGELTEKNVGNQMAVLLDDEVYTAPRLNSRISGSGQITGTFSQSELDYIIRVLGAGSLQAKLSAEPVSRSVLGPQLGADNLQRGLRAGMIAFIVVGVFMVLYYFSFGLVAMLALALNALMLVAAMALNQAAFTLPGIAGVILTFGMAVDANVLIYERVREELHKGLDLRTALRLGYSKALAAIVDGNITTLIVCVVLGFTGTQEIKGFALTLGIGTVTTLFAQLFGTRFIFAVMIEKLRWRKASMLAMVNNYWLSNKLVPNIDWLGLRWLTFGVTILLTGMGVFFLVTERNNLLGTEFRGGTSVTLTLREDGVNTDGSPRFLSLRREDVDQRVKRIGEAQASNAPLRDLATAEVIAVNPAADNVTASTFTIKTLVTDANLVQQALAKEFAKELESRQALTFRGSTAETAARSGHAFPITSTNLGDDIDRADARFDVGGFNGGLAIVLDDITPPVSKQELMSRLAQRRTQPEHAEIAGRHSEVIVLSGADNAVTSAVIVVGDKDLRYLDDQRRWEQEMRDTEWALTLAALTQQQTLAEVQSFSPAVADTFKAQAIVAVVLSTVLVVIYVWVRFNSFRYSLAAILTTLHDCLVAIGFVALATFIFNRSPGLAASIGLLPFKIDLNVVAAILTILGYSLNDTIIVMDRIRENRGKLPYASRAVINLSINQTISRTIITAGTTFLAVVVLYVVGGEAVRVFAYTMAIGILVGTYSSIAVAAPLVWVRKVDPHADDAVSGSTATPDARAAA